MNSLPVIVNGLDDKTESWTDAIDVLIHDLLYDCGLSGIVQPTSPYQQ